MEGCKNMRKKRFFAATLAAILALMAGLVPASAEEPVQLAVEQGTGAAGDTVTLNVTIDQCAGVDSLEFRLNYDPQALTLLRVDGGELLAGGIYYSNIETKGLVRFAYAAKDGLTAGGVVLSLHFTLTSDKGSAVILTDALCSSVDADYVQRPDVYVTLINGGISEGGAPIPAPLVTPWVPRTPEPTPTPTPVPTDTPAPSVTPEPTLIPSPEPAQSGAGDESPLPVLLAALAAIVLLTVIMLLLSRRSRSR